MLYKPEFSWQVWQLMESTGWTWLPFEGALLDQPDWIIHDLLTITWRKGIVDEMLSPTPKEMTK